MDNYRLILVLSLGFVSFLLYQAWVRDYGPILEERAVSSTVEATGSAVPEGVPVEAAATDGVVDSSPSVQLDSGVVRVETDVLRVDLATRGGSLVNVWLKDYKVSPDRQDEQFQLFKAEKPNLFIAQSGLLGGAADQLPNHNAVFQASQDTYELGDRDELSVDLRWQGEDGIEVIKTYRFRRGSYEVDVSHRIVNGGDEPLAMRLYSQLQRTDYKPIEASRFVRTYTGGVYYSPEDKYKKVSFSNMKDDALNRDVNDGWIAMIQHYFMAAWIPPRDRLYTFYTNIVDGDRYIIGMYSPAFAVAPGAEEVLEESLFVGPKLQNVLASIAPGLELAVDYGWLTVLAQPIFWVLDKIHSVIGNWGWSIIVLTILIKGLFYKLSETSYRSMAGMRELAPRLQALKDRYGDDKERLNQAMMDLYRKEKINPLGGCLPILIQIPVFISLYWVLLESVELRHAPFMFWLNNLSAPDPYYVLPLLMGVSMFVQTKLNPLPPDPIQAKVMMSLPFVFTVFFAFFPAGLVLYWTVNNILSIAQQWFIMKGMKGQKAKK
ncbi:membrane protein insertase YidC [Thiococcus pfennigii]|uniref:membrane protein insertase YidC n=1 Tax=Thiococcus pfennigii TaxID=1057 RepID=UPI0019050615|nr:membrane protein insertase YidC [Thiococcus pfennigii]MBK1733000.1 membrane protein insertase YidC [Thiococcus pfennigii]